MQAATAWKLLFTENHLKDRYYDKVTKRLSVGLDKVTNEKFEEKLGEEIDIILRKVNDGSYSFTRYRMLLFLKGPAKAPRQVCVPTVRDKLTLSTLNELLGLVYGSLCRTPMPQVIINDISNDLPNFDSFIKLDVSSFYASIKHDVLIRKLRGRIKKPEIIDLFQNAIETESLSYPVKEKVKRKKRELGVPEGLPISNSLANIYLASLDKKYTAVSKIKYYRYVDDILILLNREDIQPVKKAIVRDLKRLGLKTNDKNADGEISQGFEYLGYFLSSSGTTVRKSSILKAEQSFEELIINMKKEPPEYTEWKLNLKITGFIYGENKYGWMFFYSQISDTSLLFRLDDLIGKLLERYGVDPSVKRKRFVRTYHEIRQALHTTSYVPNFDKYTIDDKRRVVSRVYKKDFSKVDEHTVEDFFGRIISKEIRDIEKDIQAFS